MDLLLIQRDALASSLAGALLVAIEAKGAGREVGVVFTEEALAALARGTFAWPRELADQEMRLGIADRGARAGLPLLGRGEGRQLDVKGLVARARQSGVQLYACPIWSALLGVEGELPSGLEAIERTALLDLLGKARTVVGTF